MFAEVALPVQTSGTLAAADVRIDGHRITDGEMGYGFTEFEDFSGKFMTMTWFLDDNSLHLFST
jgi:hypothetical protein